MGLSLLVRLLVDKHLVWSTKNAYHLVHGCGHLEECMEMHCEGIARGFWGPLHTYLFQGPSAHVGCLALYPHNVAAQIQLRPISSNHAS